MKLNIQRFAAATVTFAPLNSATGVTIQDPTIMLIFSAAVTKSGGTTITNDDLSSMVVFKKTNASGADVPCTMSINAEKTVVTITPAEDLIPNQAYYVGVLGNKFYVGADATTATSATWTTDEETEHTGVEVSSNSIVATDFVACGLGGNTYTFEASDENTIIIATNTDAVNSYEVRVNAPKEPNYAGKDVADLVKDLEAGEVALINIESAKYADVTGKINIIAEDADIKLAIFYRK